MNLHQAGPRTRTSDKLGQFLGGRASLGAPNVTSTCPEKPLIRTFVERHGTDTVDSRISPPL